MYLPVSLCTGNNIVIQQVVLSEERTEAMPEKIIQETGNFHNLNNLIYKLTKCSSKLF